VAHPLRLAFVGNAASVHVQRWVEEFRDRGNECLLATVENDPIEGVNCVDISNGLPTPAGLFLRVHRLRQLLRAFAPHIVHAHYALDYGTWAALAGVHPLVLTCWGSDLYSAPSLSSLSRWKVTRALRSADLVTADSRDLLTTAVRLGASAGRTLEVVLGVNTQKFQPAQHERSRCKPIVLSTRRLEPLYHVGDLLMAVHALACKDVPCSLHIASHGILEKALLRQARDLGLTNDVQFTGRLTDEDLVGEYRSADLYVTVPEYDGTAVSLLEAMASGLPVVASDVPANRQWLGDGGGLLVPVGDVRRLAEAIGQLLADPAERLTMGTRNRALALQHGAWSANMDVMDAAYTRLKDGGT
jgi:glycosyltransferase involved in cell wall biosynthesis